MLARDCSGWRAAWFGLAVMLLGLVLAAPAAAQKKCRGTKVLHEGKCVYPHELPKSKPAPGPTPEELQRWQQEADLRDCTKARAEGTVQAWESYLQAHASGVCKKEARERIDALQAAPPPEQTPPPKEEAPPPKEDTPPVSPDRDGSTPAAAEESGISPLVYVGFGLAGVGLIVGAVTGGISLSQAADLEPECPNNVCPPERQDDIDTSTALGHTSTAFFAIAGAGAVLGVVGLLLSDFGSAKESAGLSPAVGPGFVGLTGRF